jgi:photosystem II stability/assembly factor-like uncharacterized protein
MDFWDAQHGVAFGDPIGGRLVILLTDDGGKTWARRHAPMLRNQSSGIFSICLTESNQLIAVGGDYTRPDLSSQNCSVPFDGGQSWTSVTKKPPSGFRSTVASATISETLTVVAAGTNGIDLSVDQGLTWKRISNIAVNALGFSKYGKALVTAGPKGSVYLGVPSF